MSPNLSNYSPEQLAVLRNTTVTSPPYGIHSNLINPESRASVQIGITSTLLAFALLFYFNRVYVKACLLKRHTWDDATLLIAVLFSMVLFAASTWGAQKGKLTRHNWDISLLDSMQPNFLIPYYLQFVLPPIALVFLKASFFLLYLEIFSVLRWARICCWLGLGLITIIHTSIGIASFAVASPYRWNWTHRAEPIAMVAAVMGLVVDIIILVIPIIAIERLQLLSFKQKLGAALVFTTGGVACLCSAFSVHARRVLITHPDQTWHAVVVTIATLCELLIGIICACGPAASHGFKNPQSIWKRSSNKSQSLTISDAAELKIGRQRYMPPIMNSTDKKYSRYFELDDKAAPADIQKLPAIHVEPKKDKDY